MIFSITDIADILLLAIWIRVDIFVERVTYVRGIVCHFLSIGKTW